MYCEISYYNDEGDYMGHELFYGENKDDIEYFARRGFQQFCFECNVENGSYELELFDSEEYDRRINGWE